MTTAPEPTEADMIDLLLYLTQPMPADHPAVRRVRSLRPATWTMAFRQLRERELMAQTPEGSPMNWRALPAGVELLATRHVGA
jgi:hypothetical protein